MKGYGRPLNDAIKVKPGERLQGKPQDGHVRDMRHAEESCIHGGNRGRGAGSKDGGLSPLNPLKLKPRHRAAGFGVCLAEFPSCFDSVFPHYTQFFPFVMEMYILCYCMLEACNSLFFYFIRG